MCTLICAGRLLAAVWQGRPHRSLRLQTWLVHEKARPASAIEEAVSLTTLRVELFCLLDFRTSGQINYDKEAARNTI